MKSLQFAGRRIDLLHLGKEASLYIFKGHNSRVGWNDAQRLSEMAVGYGFRKVMMA